MSNFVLVGREGFEPPKAGADRFHIILRFPVGVDYIFTLNYFEMKVFRYLVSTVPPHHLVARGSHGISISS